MAQSRIENLKALLFDAGDVIYHRPRRGALIKRFLANQGLPTVAPDQDKAATLKRQAYVGQITKEQYQDEILALHGVSDPAVSLGGRRVFDEDQRDIVFFEGVPETLHRLKDAGLRLGVVTNTYDATLDKMEWFRRVGIDSVWDSFATSCELKVSKPDPRIYRAALEPLNVQPQQTAFVGHAAAELQGAKALGLVTVAFNRDNPAVTADRVISKFAELLSLAGL